MRTATTAAALPRASVPALPSATLAFTAQAFTALSVPASAHVVVGARVFPLTLTFDDPGVGDEASLPAITNQRGAAAGGTGPAHDLDLGFELDRTIMPATALILNEGHDIDTTGGSKTETGFENLFVAAKWRAFTDEATESVVSLGLVREIGGTGTTRTGADRTGSTSPTAYRGEGLGAVPIGAFRPLAITGELSYTISDTELKQVPPPSPAPGAPASPFASGLPAQCNNGENDAWAGSPSVQYSLPYPRSQVRDVGLHGLLRDLVPIVELDRTSPASSPSAQGTTWTAAPGLILLSGAFEFGLEALVPLERTAGTNVDAVGPVHVFFDDLLPDSLGKPLFR